MGLAAAPVQLLLELHLQHLLVVDDSLALGLHAAPGDTELLAQPVYLLLQLQVLGVDLLFGAGYADAGCLLHPDHLLGRDALVE